MEDIEENVVAFNAMVKEDEMIIHIEEYQRMQEEIKRLTNANKEYEKRRKDKLIQRIIKKAYRINQNTKHDLFVNFYGHINSLEIYFYKDGWGYKEGKAKSRIEITKINLNDVNAIEQLQQCLQKLEELEEK